MTVDHSKKKLIISDNKTIIFSKITKLVFLLGFTNKHVCI